MKTLARILSLLILVSVSVFFAACDGGGGEDKSEKEAQIEKLVGTWTAQSVTYEGDPNPDYDNFTITIAKASSEALTFTTSGRPAGKLTPWDASGTFTFGSPVASMLQRGDNVPVSYTVSGTNLQMTLENYSGTGYQARTGTVAGDWVFNFTK